MALVRTQLLNLFRNPFTQKKLEMEIESICTTKDQKYKLI